MKSTNYTKIVVLSLAHLLNDIYSNFLPQMLPFLVVLSSDFTATRAAILVSAFTVSSSLVQPLLGYCLDRIGKIWIVYVGTLWMGIMLSLTGIFHNYFLIVLLAALAGLGSAVFHPQASTMVNILSGEHKAVMHSVFIAFGNMGFAISPLILIPLFHSFGLQATLVAVFPGIIVTFLLIFIRPADLIMRVNPPDFSAVMLSLKAAKELIAILAVIAIRALSYTGLLTMLPLYFKEQNISVLSASYLLSMMLASGALGGIIGGYLSDAFGRKRLIVVSLAISTVFFYSFLYTRGILSTFFLALAGAALLSSLSVTVVAAQELIPDNKAMAAGLTLGLADGVGALMVILLGPIADYWGLHTAILIIFMLPLIAALAGLFMKSNTAVSGKPG